MKNSKNEREELKRILENDSIENKNALTEIEHKKKKFEQELQKYFEVNSTLKILIEKLIFR